MSGCRSSQDAAAVSRLWSSHGQLDRVAADGDDDGGDGEGDDEEGGSDGVVVAEAVVGPAFGSNE